MVLHTRFYFLIVIHRQLENAVSSAYLIFSWFGKQVFPTEFHVTFSIVKKTEFGFANFEGL